MQTNLFTMLDKTSPNTAARATTATESKLDKTTNKSQLLGVINQYRISTDSKPILVSYSRSHGGQQRAFIWLIVKCSANELPNLKTSQQYIELFHFLNHLYSASGIDRRIQLTLDCSNLNIQFVSVENSNSQQQETKPPCVKEVDKPATPVKTYPAQEKVGETIFKSIKAQSNDFESRYDKFGFYLILPSRKSLKTQSLTRMKTVLGEVDIKYLCADFNDMSSVTYLINPANRDRFKRDVIDQAINPENKRTMYLVVQDECHWGMKLDSQADQHFINQKDLLNESLSDNVYTLQVSATAYNIEAIKDFRRDNIIRWDEVVQDMKPTNYQGRLELIEKQKIQTQSDRSRNSMRSFEEKFSSLAYLLANRIDVYVSLPELSIVCEYIVTLHYILASKKNEEIGSLFSEEMKKFVSKETQEILEGLCNVGENGKGYLVVLRLNTVATAQHLRRWLTQLLKIYDEPDIFDIVVDADDDDDCLYDHLSKASRNKYKIWWNKSNALTKEEKANFGYDNLRHLPLLLIVIEKGRMGDTFPSESFRYFDLRARYQGDILRSTYYCSLLQDVGRAFGYSNSNNERPTVFMGKEIFDFLNENKLQPHETLKKNVEDNVDAVTSTTSYVNITSNSNSMYVDFDRYWMPNEAHPFGSQAEQVKQDAHKKVASRRFLLSAHPQIGKTASFLWAVHLFVEHFNKLNYVTRSRNQKEYFTTLYSFRNCDSGELHNKLMESEEQQNEWNAFHDSAASIYDVWRAEKDEIVPIEECIKIIEKHIPNIRNEPASQDIVIIDMGCGLAKLAQHFKEVNSVKVVSIDHRRHPLVPSDINVREIDMKNVTLETIENKLAHFIIFALSLWGNAENIKDYINVAITLLEPKGCIILIDAKNNSVDDINLQTYITSVLHKTSKLTHRVSSQRPNSRFFRIVAQPLDLEF
ncbi:unnamed protein product [Rotaria magnacalcarata]